MPTCQSAVKINYLVVYEVIDDGPDIWWGPLIMVFLGILVCLYHIKFHKSYSTKRAYGIVMGLVVSIFALLFSLATIPSQLTQYYETNKSYLEGKYHTVEGVVEDFVPMPFTGHMQESFSVSGVSFDYSDFSTYHGFKNTKSHGGPIEGNGQLVRIGYIPKKKRNTIIKLEIEE